MHLAHHIVVSGVAAAVLWAGFRSSALALASVLTGVFIDLDHWLDYFREYGFRLSVRAFFDVSRRRAWRHLYLVLHGWEWLVVLLVACAATNWNPWLVGACIGWTHHLVADQIVNRPVLLGYWLVYRWAHRFEKEAMYPPE